MTPDVRSVMPVAERPPVVMVEGEGSWLRDSEGRTYLDFVQGWAVNCLGHCPRVVADALGDQARRLVNCSPAYHNEPMARLAAMLAGEAGVAHVFLCNSGAEANEVARAALDRGLLVNAPRPDTLRFMPALTVSHTEIDEMVARLRRSLAAA